MISKYFKYIIFGLFLLSVTTPITKDAPVVNIPPGTEASIGEYGTLGNPLNDRAKGFLLQGMVKNAVTNYGNFISGDEYPSGVWKDYGYLYTVSMLAGVPGQKYSNVYKWYKAHLFWCGHPIPSNLSLSLSRSIYIYIYIYIYI